MSNDVLQREIDFHDDWANSVDIRDVKVDEFDTACTLPEMQYIMSHIPSIKGRRILEIGCGCGEASVYFAKKGAKVTATDLSPGMVDLTKKVADYHGVKLEGICCSSDALPFRDNSFDIVYAANVLHHVNIENTVTECKRVLKKGGLFICWDPIKYNPAINIYRRLANGVRTEDEHPIDFKYINCIKNNYRKVRYKGFWLFTNLVFVKYYFIDRINPSKERYWKKIIDDSHNLEKMYNPLFRFDSFLLKVCPPLKWLCWNMVVIAKRKR